MSLQTSALTFYSSLSKSLVSLCIARLYTPQSPSQRDLTGQTAIITGANSGIGLSIATSLAKQGATVYLACRDTEKAQLAGDGIVSRVGEAARGRVRCLKLDVSDLASVRTFCANWGGHGQEQCKIDMLVHNAGIASPPTGSKALNHKGLHLVYMTNFLGSYLMTCLLERNLAEEARVIFTSSTASYAAGDVLALREGEGSWNKSLVDRVKKTMEWMLGTSSSEKEYAHSKGLQVLLALLLQKHFDSSASNRRSAHAFTPGFTSTPIFDKFEVDWRTWMVGPLFALLKSTVHVVAVEQDEGAKTGAWLAACGHEIEGGGFWEWSERRVSLVDFTRAQLGEEEFERRAKALWKQWEEDADVSWEVTF